LGLLIPAYSARQTGQSTSAELRQHGGSTGLTLLRWQDLGDAGVANRQQKADSCGSTAVTNGRPRTSFLVLGKHDQ